MKQKLLSALVVAAVAGMAANANAGVIQASYKNFAAEIFGADITMKAPVIGYSLAQPLTGSAGNPNTFTVKYTLSNGAKWVAAPDASLVSVNNVDITPPVAGTIDATNASVVTYVFTLNGGITFPTNSTIVLGSNGLNAAADGTINNVYKELQKPALAANYCAPTPTQIGVTIYMENNAGTQFETNFTQAPLSNTTPILQSDAATETSVTPGDKIGITNATRETSRVDVLVGSLGKFFTTSDNNTAVADVTDATAPLKQVLNLGAVGFDDRKSLYDADGSTIYGVTTGFGGGAFSDGIVSHDGLTVKVSGKFVTGGLLTLNSAPGCAAATDLASDAAGTTYNSDRTLATITLTAAQLGANSTVYACYTVPGTKVIPTAQFAVESGTLARLAASKELATPICPGALYNLVANGVRVDVRNYVPAVAATPSGGWKSIVRIINTDESQAADVIGTVLHRNGDIGASATLVNLKPREVVYMQSSDIDTKLNAAATAAVTSFGADDIGQNARLRLTAANSSIRVQNYLYNPVNGNFIEGSSAQGDEGPDYAKARDRDNK